MAKQEHSSYNDILKDIRNKQFAPIYLLMGEEPYFIDELTNQLQETVVPEDERDFNQTVLYGADTSIDTVINASRRFPIMAERQIVLFKEVQSASDAKRNIEKLVPYVANPSKTTVLVITFKGDTLSASSNLIKEIKNNGGVVFDSAKVKDWNLDGYIKGYCKEKSLRIDDKSVAILREFIGNDLKRLFGEIDKLIVSLPVNSREITPDLIERNIGFSKDFNNFELIRALVNRDYVKSMQIVDYFERNPKQNPVVMTIPILFNFFTNILLAHYAQDKSDNGLMQQLRLKSSYVLKEIKPGMNIFSAKKTIYIIEAIRELDCKSKGINSIMQKDYSLLKELIYKIFTI